MQMADRVTNEELVVRKLRSRHDPWKFCHVRRKVSKIGPTQAHPDSESTGGQVYEVDEKTEIRKGTPLVEGKRRENIAGSQTLRMSTINKCRMTRSYGEPC